MKTGPRFFQNNAVAKERLNKVVDQNPNYLAHEYLNECWTVHWAGDVIEEMQSEAKLDYIGQAYPVEAYRRFVLPDVVWEQMADISDPGFMEELKDTWLNRQFRKDLYCRGGLKLPGRQQVSKLLQTQVVSVLENMDNLDFNFQLPIGRVNPNKELYQKLLGLVDKNPLRLEDVHQELGVQPAQAIQLGMVLTSLGWVHPVVPDNDPEPSRRLNQVFAEQSHFSSEYNFLAAPAMGSGKRASMTDLLILAGISNGYSSQQSQELSQFVWQSLASRNLQLKKEDTTLQTPEENLSQLREVVLPGWQEKTLPVWRAVGVVEELERA